MVQGVVQGLVGVYAKSQCMRSCQNKKKSPHFAHVKVGTKLGLVEVVQDVRAVRFLVVVQKAVVVPCAGVWDGGVLT